MHHIHFCCQKWGLYIFTTGCYTPDFKIKRKLTSKEVFCFVLPVTLVYDPFSVEKFVLFQKLISAPTRNITVIKTRTASVCQADTIVTADLDLLEMDIPVTVSHFFFSFLP